MTMFEQSFNFQHIMKKTEPQAENFTREHQVPDQSKHFLTVVKEYTNLLQISNGKVFDYYIYT